MAIPVMNKDKKDVVNTTTNIVDDVDRDDDFSDNVKDVTLGDFNKFVKIQDTLEKSIERRNLRYQPGVSFGEKLGMKIEEKVSDGFIDKMLGNMFNLGGTGSTKPGGWLEIAKVILDSGFAQQAGSKLPETIAALSKTIGPQRTEQLADAVVQAVNPKAKSIEDEQRKMEEFVISLNPVNIIDINKFMNLVNANPSNNKVTDTNQARNILIEEQDRIRRDNPELERQLDSPGKRYIEENRTSNRLNDDFFDGRPRDTNQTARNVNQTARNVNQMNQEQILSIDMNNDDSIVAYAWSKGYGQILQETNGLNKIRGMLAREQENIMKQIASPGESEQTEQQMTGEIEQGDMKWSNEDVGKKGIGKMDKKDEILVPPHIADGPVTENGEVKVMKKSDFLKEIGMTSKENQSESQPQSESQHQDISQQEANNSIMELLQKMAQNFDNGISEINDNINSISNRAKKVATPINTRIK